MTWNVTGEQVQVATGDHAQQSINLGATAEQIGLGLQGVVEYLQRLALLRTPESQEEVRVLAAEAVADLKSDAPTGEPARRFLEWGKDCVRKGGTNATVAASTVMFSGLLQDVERLVSTLA